MRMHRTAIRHEHNNQLLGFIYQASKGNQTYIVGIDALEKLHTGLMIPTDASMWLELKRYFGLGCLVICCREEKVVEYSWPYW